jgi:hypothetical protein
MRLMSKTTARFALSLLLGMPTLLYANRSDLDLDTQGDFNAPMFRGSQLRVQRAEAAAHSIRLRSTRDAQGRIHVIESDDGRSLTISFDSDGAAKEIRSTEGLIWLLKKNKDKKMEKQQSVAPAAEPVKHEPKSAAKMLSGGGECLDGVFCEEVNFFAQCAADPTCFGIMDDLSSVIVSYFTGGGAAIAGFMGALYGTTMEALTAGLAALAEIGVFADIVTVYGFQGIGVGLVFVAGYFVGTVIYNQYGDIISRSF